MRPALDALARAVQRDAVTLDGGAAVVGLVPDQLQLTPYGRACHLGPDRCRGCRHGGQFALRPGHEHAAFVMAPPD